MLPRFLHFFLLFILLGQSMLQKMPTKVQWASKKWTKWVEREIFEQKCRNVSNEMDFSFYVEVSLRFPTSVKRKFRKWVVVVIVWISDDIIKMIVMVFFVFFSVFLLYLSIDRLIMLSCPDILRIYTRKINCLRNHLLAWWLMYTIKNECVYIWHF